MKALVLEVAEVQKNVTIATDAIASGHWSEAELALLDVQMRAARLVREIALRRSPIKEGAEFPR